MSTDKAICIKCGTKKNRPYQKCQKCGFTPKDEDSLVRSVYLSTGRFDDPAEAQAYGSKLENYSSDIRAGRPIDYDSAELDRLLKQKHLVETAPMPAVLNAVFRLFLPGIIFLAILLGLYIVLKFIKGN